MRNFIPASPFASYKYTEGNASKAKKRNKTVECLDGEQMQKLLALLDNELCNINASIDKSHTSNEGRYHRMSEAEFTRRADKRRLEYMQKQLFVWLAYITSSRRGEVAALRWPDIDLVNSVITFNGNNYFKNGTGTMHKATLKDGSENKVISIDSVVFALLDEVYKLQSKVIKDYGWSNTGYVFISTRPGKVQAAGSPINPDSLTGWFNKFCVKYHEELGLTEEEAKRVHVHTLRHSSISFQLNNGVPLNVIADRAGHADESMIKRVYGHTFDEAERKAAELFGVFKRV